MGLTAYVRLVSSARFIYRDGLRPSQREKGKRLELYLGRSLGMGEGRGYRLLSISNNRTQTYINYPYPVGSTSEHAFQGEGSEIC